ncbi:uncharacterized protein LOC124277223 isoform X2 [Haliotis rubra]|nr:uncharacterized protein LOC124277223 isoform X2 [Haliotis rubra]
MTYALQVFRYSQTCTSRCSYTAWTILCIDAYLCTCNICWEIMSSCQPGRFGDSCNYSCHCGTSCDDTTGACPGSCDQGWTKEGGLCQTRNIALSKTTSTTPEAYVGWPASNAVDGDSDTGGEGRTCFHAGGSPSDWTVDLGRDFQLYDIRIYSRRN